MIGLTGRSPGLLVGVLPIFVMTSIPSTISPKMLCLLSSHGVGASVMKTLIAQGADVSVNNGEGLTALALAQKRNHREAVALLQRHGAR